MNTVSYDTWSNLRLFLHSLDKDLNVNKKNNELQLLSKKPRRKQKRKAVELVSKGIEISFYNNYFLTYVYVKLKNHVMVVKNSKKK